MVMVGQGLCFFWAVFTVFQHQEALRSRLLFSRDRVFFIHFMFGCVVGGGTLLGKKKKDLKYTR